MGYTHYYDIHTDRIPEGAYDALVADFKLLIRFNNGSPALGYAVGWDGDLNTRVEFEDRIAFNGMGVNGCESFIVDRFPTAPSWYEEQGWSTSTVRYFCKTRGKSYDPLVVAVLLAMKDHYGDAVEIDSDGSWDDWASGRKLYERVLGRTAECPWKSVAL